MATKEQEVFCVTHFAQTKSVVIVQRVFPIKFHCAPPSDNNIRRSYHHFEDNGCLCKETCLQRDLKEYGPTITRVETVLNV